jgi:hypothetical protein
LPKTIARLKNPQIQVSILFFRIGKIITLGEAPTLGLGFVSIQLDNQLRCLILFGSNPTLGTTIICIEIE